MAMNANGEYRWTHRNDDVRTKTVANETVRPTGNSGQGRTGVALNGDKQERWQSGLATGHNWGRSPRLCVGSLVPIRLFSVLNPKWFIHVSILHETSTFPKNTSLFRLHVLHTFIESGLPFYYIVHWRTSIILPYRLKKTQSSYNGLTRVNLAPSYTLLVAIWCIK